VYAASSTTTIAFPPRCRPAHPAAAGRLAALCLGRWLWPLWLMLALLLGTAPAARAQGIELQTLKTERSDDALTLSFSALFELPRPVEEALQKGVPLYFTAEASVYRSRWYWRDARVIRASRSWRLAWQPLTRQFRVSTGGLNQNYGSLHEALGAMRGVQGWHIADIAQLEDDAKHYLEFNYKLDTSQLPRPMQIGLGSPEGWVMNVSRSISIDLSAHGSP
jgi:hypothetical protein